MRLYVRVMSGEALTLYFDEATTVEEIKLGIREQNGAKPAQMQLVAGGRSMSHDQTLQHYGLRDRSTVHCVLRLGAC